MLMEKRKGIVKTYKKKCSKTTAEQSVVSFSSQCCLLSSFINLLLEYSSTLVERHPSTEREMNRALYNPDNQQCITAFVIVITSSVINLLLTSISTCLLISCLLLILTSSFSVKGLKRDRGGQGFRLQPTV